MLKSELREEMRRLKRQHGSGVLAELSLAVTGRVMRHSAFRHARTVLLYWPLADEVDTRPLLPAAAGKTLLLPRVTGSATMELRLYDGPQSLAEGAFHIMEPTGRLFTDYPSVDLAIIPGMAFDAAGNRLGRGRGYYDRFLPLLPQAYKIGVCFPFQLVGSVPTEATDARMDEVIY